MAEWLPTRRQFISDLAAGIVVTILVAFALWGWRVANETGVSRLPWNAFGSLTPWQIATLILSGSVVTLTFSAIQIVRRNTRSSVEQLPEAEGTSTPSMAVSFDPYRYMSSRIMRVEMTGLFATHEPYMDFVVFVKQTSDYRVNLREVRGRVSIGGTGCSFAPHLTRPIALSDPRSSYEAIIHQPLTPEMANAMLTSAPDDALNVHREDSRLRVSLTGLKWIGSVALPQGETELPDRVVCDEEFTLLGPISEGDADKVFVRGGIFLSSQVWRNAETGLLRKQS